MKSIKIKHKKLLLIIGILFGITLIIGTSYAVFSIRHENSSNQIISAGELELTYNSCTTMTTEMVPLSNEDGLAQAGCNVTIENTGTLDAIYKVLIYNNPNGSNLLNHDNLYISIDNSTPVLLSTITKLENTEKYNLKEDILLVDNTRTHNIKMWIKEDATTDIIGKNINFIVDIEAEVAPEPNYLASETLVYPNSTDIFWGSSIGRDAVEEISFTTTNEVPVGVIGSWDAGEEKNGKVMAWYTDTNANGKYEVVAGAKGGVYAPVNSTSLFYCFMNLNTLNLTNLDTSNVTNMNDMFLKVGYSSTIFTLDLGENFDTSKVTNMKGMFSDTSYNSTVFTLDLGDKFDTSNVTNMQGMFGATGRSSTVFTLDLGDKFDTSNVTNMQNMFYLTGWSSTIFALDLDNKFDTSKVTNMSGMFYRTGYSNPNFILDLRNNFNIGAVTSTNNLTFATGNTSHKIYVGPGNVLKAFISGKGFTGTIIGETTSSGLN